MLTNIEEPRTRRVGAAPLFRQMADDIHLVPLINQMVRWDDRQTRLSPGERILVLVLDVLSGKTPLYRVWERFASTDLEILVGAGRRPEDFTDDSLGRALDKLARAQPAKVFSTIALAAYAHDGITLGAGHWDSTSRTLWGDFATAAEAEPRPAYGHSKDHRPDLKQILMTLFVNREGVPLFGTVESGNQSDKTLNGAMIDRLTDALDPTQLANLIYVADSALVTGPNLDRLARHGIHFISRCPETFGVVAAAKAAAWAADDWIDLGTLADRAQAAQYWASEQVGTIADRPYRLVVYRSNTVDRRRTRTLDRDIAAQHRALARAADRLAVQAFACEADAQAALDHWLASTPHAWHAVSGQVVAETRQTRPGRPRKNPRPEDVQTTWRVAVTIGAVRQDERERELQRRSGFVLITTVPTDKLSAADLLTEYKGQVHVERHFHFLKDPLFVDALYVKKPERIEALGYVLLLACLLYSLVERRIRAAAVAIPSPSRRVLKNPTGHEVVRHLDSLHVAQGPTGQRVVSLPRIFHATLEAILKALDMPITVFTEPPLRDPPP
jgi:transposase